MAADAGAGAPAYPWSNSELMQATASHTLTPEQMTALDFVEVQWQGKAIYAKRDQWVLSLKHAAPKYDRDGNLLDLNVEWAGPNVKAPELQAKLDAQGLGVRFKQYLGAKHLATIEVPEGLGFDALNAALKKLPGFESVSPDAAVWTTSTTPNDTQFGSQWALNNTGQSGGTSDADIDAPEAWDVTTGYSGTVVGVIDSGLAYLHPDIAANVWTNAGEVAGNGIDDDGNGYTDDVRGWDFVDGDNNPDHAAGDTEGHGPTSPASSRPPGTTAPG